MGSKQVGPAKWQVSPQGGSLEVVLMLRLGCPEGASVANGGGAMALGRHEQYAPLIGSAI